MYSTIKYLNALNKVCAGSLNKRFIHAKRITYSEFGDPLSVLKLENVEIPAIRPHEILVKMIAAPIHPAEINTIQGQYPLKPSLPGLPGFESSGRIEEVGSNVKDFKVGDLVTPVSFGLGAWSTYLKASFRSFVKLPSNVDPVSLSMAFSNPASAYLMITGFSSLKSGEYIIQNGCTSAVGIYAIQISKILGLRTINIFRERESGLATEETRKMLQSYGGDINITEKELKEKITKKEMPLVSMALTCVAGSSINLFHRCLKPASKIIVYGGMSRTPLSTPVGPLIFNNTEIRGFWLTSWLRRNGIMSQEVSKVRCQLLDWFASKELVASPYHPISFENWKEAVEAAMFKDAAPTGITRKTVLKMS